jgi:hypothetical protein
LQREGGATGRGTSPQVVWSPERRHCKDVHGMASDSIQGSYDSGQTLPPNVALHGCTGECEACEGQRLRKRELPGNDQ